MLRVAWSVLNWCWILREDAPRERTLHLSLRERGEYNGEAFSRTIGRNFDWKIGVSRKNAIKL
jgi:hypothetical protein